MLFDASVQLTKLSFFFACYHDLFKFTRPSPWGAHKNTWRTKQSSLSSYCMIAAKVMHRHLHIVYGGLIGENNVIFTFHMRNYQYKLKTKKKASGYMTIWTLTAYKSKD